MYFARQLERREISDPATRQRVASKKQALGLTPVRAITLEAQLPTPRSLSEVSQDEPLQVHAGDVVTFPRDEDSGWGKSPVWYAYVQAVRRTQSTTLLDILWL